MEKIFHANVNQKRTGVAKLIRYKGNFFFMLLKHCNKRQSKSIHQVNITIINVYALNIGALKYIKQIQTEQQEINSNTIIFKDYDTQISTMDKSHRQEIKNHWTSSTLSIKGTLKT